MKRNHPNSHKVPGDVGFGLGFFAGAVIGSLGIYLFTTPEGRNIKQSIQKEFKQHRENYLQSLLVIDPQTADVGTYKHSSIRTFIASIREKISNKKAKIIIKNTSIEQKQKKKHYFKKK